MYRFLQKQKLLIAIFVMLLSVIWITPGYTAANAKPVVKTASNLSFSGKAGSDIAPKIIRVRNRGDHLLGWIASSDVSWISITPNAGKVPVGKSDIARVKVNTAGLPVGVSTGIITIKGIKKKAKSTKINVSVTLSYADLRGAIKGVVVAKATGNPVSGAVASLAYDKDADGVAEVVTETTDASGQYLFTGVPVSGGISNTFGTITTLPGQTYNITITFPGSADNYVALYPTARLDYNYLMANDIIEVYTNASGQKDWEVVGNLMTEAEKAEARRACSIVTGKVVDKLTKTPLSGAAIGIVEDVVEGNDGPPTHGMITTSTTTDAEGNFTLSDVPELDCYAIKVSASNYSSDVIDDLCANICGFTTYVDSDSNDGNPMTAVALLPITNELDTTKPYIASSSDSPGLCIAPEGLSGPFTFTFSEPMDQSTGTLIINTTGFKSIIPSTQTWDSTGTILTLTPSPNPIPQGVQFNITGFQTFRDLAGNSYNGLAPQEDGSGFVNDNYISKICGTNDDYTDEGCPAINGSTSLTTILASGSLYLACADADLLQASDLTQICPTLADALTGLVVTQSGVANNQNMLAWGDRLADGAYTHDTPISGATLLGGGAIIPILGIAAGQTDVVSLSWTAPAVTPRAYNIYAENNTGGFLNGLPVQVVKGIKSGNPPTTGTIALSAIEQAINTFNNGPDGLPSTGDELVDPISYIQQVNVSTSTTRGATPAGTVLFFDNGFSINLAVTTINLNGDEGPFSNVIAGKDCGAPIIKEQDNYIAGGTEGFGWSALTTTSPVQFPLYAISNSLPTLDIAGSAATSLLNTNSSTHVAGTYGAEEWTAFAAGSASFVVTANEDLSSTATPTVTVADSTGTAKDGVTATVALSTVAGKTDNDSKKELTVTMLNGDIAGLSQSVYANSYTSDRLIFGLTDEAGNEGTSVLQIADLAGPFITSAVAARTGVGATGETLTLTFSENVDETSAELIANYSGISAGTPVLGTDGKTVTITGSGGTAPETNGTAPGSPGDYDALLVATATSANPVIAGGVEDLAGNTFGGLGFNPVDTIKPRVLIALDQVAGGTPINITTGNSNYWEVGDEAELEVYTIRLLLSEPIFTAAEVVAAVPTAKVSATIAPIATYPASTVTATTVVGTPNAVDLTFFHSAAAPAVAAGNSLTVSVTDLAGNTSSGITITLGAAGLTAFTGEGI